MSSFILKLLACVFMLIDHTLCVLFPQSLILRTIGRPGYPIFMWTISNGYKHTRDINKYLMRLAAFSIISQLPFMLVFNTTCLNIFFTLILGLLCIFCYDKINNRFLSITCCIVMIFLAQVMGTDYGAYGVITIFLFYFFRDNKVLMLVSQTIATVIYVLIVRNYIYLFAIPAFLLVCFYNGKQGPKLKYLFYIFYPGHLVLLLFIKILTNS